MATQGRWSEDARRGFAGGFLVAGVFALLLSLSSQGSAGVFLFAVLFLVAGLRQLRSLS